MSRFAINVADLLHDEFRPLVQFMVVPVAPGRQRVKVGPNLDDHALVLECPEEQGKAIVGFVQDAGRKYQHLIRCYREGPRGGWREVTRKRA